VVGDAGDLGAERGLDLAVDEEDDHRLARRPGVDAHVEPVLLEQPLLLGHVVGGEIDLEPAARQADGGPGDQLVDLEPAEPPGAWRP
jgi:hypothetical protein